ncbi:MAG: hypothetical protein QOJ59_1071, partial [Thermomicrobiales bacterium]|nr:hypothetical protein [Thermomicrobiales bacterium]
MPPLYVERTLPRVELPRYQTEVAAGFDLAMWGWYVEGEEEPIARAFYLPPGRSIKVRTGSATTCGSRAATGTGRRPSVGDLGDTTWTWGTGETRLHLHGNQTTGRCRIDDLKAWTTSAGWPGPTVAAGAPRGVVRPGAVDRHRPP